ncbi:hypothetical protein T07_10935, partial [Trichinella nelsoni]
LERVKFHHRSFYICICNWYLVVPRGVCNKREYANFYLPWGIARGDAWG